MSKRVLAVDDDPETTRQLRGLLESRGFSVEVENDSTRALSIARSFRPDVVIIDYLMPKAHGGDVAWQLASDPVFRKTRMIMCSGVPYQEFSKKLPPVHIDIMEKPVDTEALVELIDSPES
jgi:CheY-like chemotaxis protein